MTPYPEQLKAVQAAVRAGKGGIVMPTASGKSITMALLIQEMQMKTLIVVPNLELKKQLSETFAGLFGNLNNITIENIDSPRLQKKHDVDLLIVDECHRSAATTYRKLNKQYWNHIYHRFYFSATFFRNDPEEQLLLESVVGTKIYELSYKKAVQAGMIMPVEAYYIESPKQEDYYGYSYQQVYRDLVVNNEARNVLISRTLSRLADAGQATLCLVKEVAHGKILAELTGLPFICGEDEESRSYIRQFKDGGLTAVIATTAMLGEGVDTKPCEFVIIAGGGKAKSQFMQQVGRTLRKYKEKSSGKVILVKDQSHKYLIRHYGAQKKILKEEYGCIPLKLEV